MLVKVTIVIGIKGTFNGYDIKFSTMVINSVRCLFFYPSGLLVLHLSQVDRFYA